MLPELHDLKEKKLFDTVSSPFGIYRRRGIRSSELIRFGLLYAFVGRNPRDHQTTNCLRASSHPTSGQEAGFHEIRRVRAQPGGAEEEEAREEE